MDHENFGGPNCRGIELSDKPLIHVTAKKLDENNHLLQNALASQPGSLVTALGGQPK